LIFVLVVIFQEDLRRFFERLAMLGNIGKKFEPLSGLKRTTEVIAQTAATLAKKHVGALIVYKAMILWKDILTEGQILTDL